MVTICEVCKHMLFPGMGEKVASVRKIGFEEAKPQECHKSIILRLSCDKSLFAQVNLMPYRLFHSIFWFYFGSRCV